MWDIIIDPAPIDNVTITMSKFVKLYLEISGKIRELVIIIALVLDPWDVFNIAPITKHIKQTLIRLLLMESKNRGIISTSSEFLIMLPKALPADVNRIIG